MSSDDRPLIHFTPARNWMNDPNGLVYDRGVYHLFYQYNPFGNSWGNMSWGHATSRDLTSWHELPVAIACTPTEQIYSGSVVVDSLNTSELGSIESPPLVAVYTRVSPDGIQTQALAFSTDGGYAWEKYAGNPVLDRDSPDFRDPKVFRYTSPTGDSTWIMVAVEATLRQVLIYSSQNLRDWIFESSIGPFGPEDVVWECPDLFALPVDGDDERLMWVLLVSTNGVGDAVDSSMSYLVGSFDGHSFVVDPAGSWTPVDHGRDFYAAVTFSGVPDDRRIALGWAGNWQYASETPTAPWRGVMSSPRELSLTRTAGGFALIQTPVLDLESVSVESETVRMPIVSGSPSTTIAGRRYVLTIDWQAGPDSILRLDVLAGTHGEVTIGYDTATMTLSLDRRRSGIVDLHPGFATVNETSVPLRDGRLSLTVIVDECVVEIFADEGAVTFTDLAFAPADADVLRVAATSGTGTVTVSPLREPRCDAEGGAERGRVAKRSPRVADGLGEFIAG
ncbi:glycoside hydrolase family 32 protein [Agreia pratensis]|uniref:Levanase/fructan beta-fructosidase n=1 Tax=Agreia pratensis TaxID=150121 RepID=A0A1X7KUA9_9MICO|nr:glycoside hydrolase family 32 protein [Agreia pratensis]MBF4635842.1 glycoside hydrolase family 32 protein [Agreia pratensis]SMG45108.1 levanase/fructan beta-fructosidase [Agreia pratensis]